MKKFLLALVACIGLSGCVAEDRVYYAPPGVYETGSVEFCDDYGCRWVNAPYYYDNGDVIYWDAHFGIWVGPRGYWHGGAFYHGWHPGYHSRYHHGWYHRQYYYERREHFEHGHGGHYRR